MEDIYHAIVKTITLQKNSKKLKTQLLLNSKVFGKIDISITTYSTNPFTFHIKVQGNEKIQQLSTLYQNILINQIKMALPNIQVHMAIPILRKNDRFTTRKKKPLYKQKEVDKVKNIKDTSI